MAGIISYGAYIPLRRLGKGTQGWRLPSEKAAAYYDEDSLTMAVAAGINCVDHTDRSEIDGLYFASTTAPYKEKLAATTAAMAIDMRSDILTMDIGDTLRAGTAALRTAVDTIKAGSAKKIMVTVSDARLAAPPADQTFGDGAAAFLIGDEDVIAELEDSYTVSNEILDVWRSDAAQYVHTWEDRWVQDEGYLKVMPEVVNAYFKKSGLSPKDITKVCYYGPNPRRHPEMGKKLGFSPEQIQDSLFNTVGNTGSALAPMILVGALEDAKPGDTLMCIAYGDGVDILLFKVTDAITKLPKKKAIKWNTEHKWIIPNSGMYSAFRHQPSNPEGGFGPAASAVLRERCAIYPFYGTRCKTCGNVQYPPERVCAKCQTKDNFEPIRLSDQKAKIFTRVLDFQAPVPPYDRPGVDVMLEWEIGGRAIIQITDKIASTPEDVPIGMELEMTFRKLRSGGGIHHYFWKCMPLRESWTAAKEEK